MVLIRGERKCANFRPSMYIVAVGLGQVGSHHTAGIKTSLYSPLLSYRRSLRRITILQRTAERRKDEDLWVAHPQGRDVVDYPRLTQRMCSVVVGASYEPIGLRSMAPQHIGLD